MKTEFSKIDSLSKRLHGVVRTARSGHPYLIVPAAKCSERLRIMYFERTRRFKIYLDTGLAQSRPIGNCTTPEEAVSIIESYR